MNNIHNGMKYFLTRFRNSMKNRTITSNAQIQIHARDRVERINNQKNIIGNS